MDISSPLRLANFIICPVPRLFPSQNAISASEHFAISAFLTIPAALPSNLHLAGCSSKGSLNSFANLSPRESAPRAWPETMMTLCVFIFSCKMESIVIEGAAASYDYPIVRHRIIVSHLVFPHQSPGRVKPYCICYLWDL